MQQPELASPVTIHNLSTPYLAPISETLEDALRIGHWSTPKWSKRIQIVVHGYAIDTRTDREYDFQEEGRIVRALIVDSDSRSHDLYVFAIEDDVHTLVRIEPGSVDHTWETVIFSVVDSYE